MNNLQLACIPTLIVIILAGTFTVCSAGELKSSEEAAGPAGQVILDACCYWRVHLTLRPALVEGAGAEVKLPPEEIQPNTPLPPPDWIKPNFDDSSWWRDPAPLFDGAGLAQGMNLALLCMRGKFEVTDPGQVRDLSLSVSFRGGAVVYLNGREIARNYLPEGTQDPLAPAEIYPEEAHGFNVHHYALSPRMKAMERRTRQIENVKIDSSALRKGINVLALEIHRAPLRPSDFGGYGSPKMWNTAGFLDLHLMAGSDAGVVPAIDRPKGLQIWNAATTELILDVDYGTPAEKLLPVRIAAARNGSFSGLVVLSSDSPIRKPRAKMGDLTSRNGRIIKGSDVLVRYAVGGGQVPNTRVPRPFYSGWDGHRGWDTHRRKAPTVPWRLCEAAPTEIKVASLNKLGTGYRRVFGAVLPVWITIGVPKDAVAGPYEGTLAVSTGDDRFDVPVRLEVSDWTFPDPSDYKSFCDAIESPTSIRYRFGVEQWSDAHFEMMGKTFDVLRGLANRTLYIPVRTKTDFGNEEGMIRWIKSGATYTCDFTIFERYLDLAIERMGKPQHVVFYVWDCDMGGHSRPATPGGFVDAGFPGTGYAGAGKVLPPSEDTAIPVSFLDPATKQVSEGFGPSFGDASAKEFWKPFVEGIRKRLKERGLDGTATLGLFGDFQPLPGVMSFWREMMPEAPWASSGHVWVKELHGSPVAFGTAWRWDGNYSLPDPGVERVMSWRDDKVKLAPYRIPVNRFPSGYFANMYEFNLSCGQDGLGRIFADFFPVKTHEKAKHSARLLGRYQATTWGTMNWGHTWLGPAPEGPVATVAVESLREGMQWGEARIFIQDAILDHRDALGETLAKSAQDILDKRVRLIRWANMMPGHGDIPPFGEYWLGGTDTFARNRKLYDTAAEIARTLK